MNFLSLFFQILLTDEQFKDIVLYYSQTPKQTKEMDFTQKKLTRAEWESIEIPIAPSEKEIVEMICRGYHSLTIRENAHTSLFSLIKIPPTKEMEYALYQKYFQPWISTLFPHFSTAPCPCDSNIDLNKLLEIGKSTQTVPLKSADKIRLSSTASSLPATVYEMILVDACKNKHYFHLKEFF